MDLIRTLTKYGVMPSMITPTPYQRDAERPTYLIHTARDDALMLWGRLHDLVSQTGYWPVLGWERFQQPPWSEERPETVIETAMRLDIAAWFKTSGGDALRGSMKVKDTTAINATTNPSVAQPHDTFRIPSHRFPFSDVGRVPIAMIPTPAPWQVPAYLDITGNDPPAAIHVALLQYWYERWGVELVGAVAGEIELQVLRPPSTPDDADEVAIEQYLYCPDIVDQQVGSVMALAQQLMNSRVWWFWWD